MANDKLFISWSFDKSISVLAATTKRDSDPFTHNKHLYNHLLFQTCTLHTKIGTYKNKPFTSTHTRSLIRVSNPANYLTPRGHPTQAWYLSGSTTWNPAYIKGEQTSQKKQSTAILPLQFNREPLGVLHTQNIRRSADTPEAAIDSMREPLKWGITTQSSAHVTHARDQKSERRQAAIKITSIAMVNTIFSMIFWPKFGTFRMLRASAPFKTPSLNKLHAHHKSAHLPSQIWLSQRFE